MSALLHSMQRGEHAEVVRFYRPAKPDFLGNRRSQLPVICTMPSIADMQH